MNEKEMQSLFDTANAEEASRNIASIIIAFRDKLHKNELPTETIEELTAFYGRALIAKIFFTQLPELSFVEEEEKT